jgi:ATP-binding cassette subfamily B protein
VTTLVEASWPIERAGDVLSALARAAGIPVRNVEPPRGYAASTEVDAGRWIERAGEWLGTEAEAVDTPYELLEDLVRGAGPALVRLETEEGPCFAALLRANRRQATLIGPDGPRRVATRDLRDALASPLEKPLGTDVERMVDLARVAPARKPKLREALLREHLRGWRVGGVWIVRRPATSSFLGQLRGAGALRELATLFAAHAAQYALALGAWWTIGQGALKGYLDPAWLVAWAMLLTSLVPLRLLELRAQGRIAVEGAAMLKRRLLQGALAVEPEEMRGEGVGRLLGRIMEANAVESLATTGGVTALMAVVDLGVCAAVLGVSGAFLPAAVLLTTVGAGVYLARRYGRSCLDWTDQRLELTQELVERMTGHRTRIAQQPRGQWHRGEDVALARYFAESLTLDRRWAALGAVLPGAWLVVGLASLSPTVVSSTATPAEIAVAIGAVLLGFLALRKLTAGARSVSALLVAWRQVAPLFDAGGRAESARAVDPVGPAQQRAAVGDVVLSAHDLVFRYRAGGEPVLRGCTMRVATGDRVLLEGPSGGGKSTLSLLLAGVRTPESGTLLVGGLDRHTLGAHAWRRKVVTVPQFHENHVLSGTFAFNLLMGRAWPPRAEDLVEAEGICRELGLGELMERMPAGLQQMVGETGWQLSHGERSRMFVARALLQKPEVVVLDESFGALDPQTMQVALDCVLRRAPALIVVAHP